MGIPEYVATRYEGRVKHGSILLSVHCDDSVWVKRAENLLRTTGAEDVASSGEASADFAQSDKPMPRSRTPITEEIHPVIAAEEIHEPQTTSAPRNRLTPFWPTSLSVSSAFHFYFAGA